MARKLLNSFDEFETKETATDDVNEQQQQQTFTEDVNIEGKQETQTLNDVKQALEQTYKESLNKEKLADTHERTTFYVRKDLNKRLDKLSKNKRGFKKIFINIAIESLLNEMEKKNDAARNPKK